MTDNQKIGGKGFGEKILQHIEEPLMALSLATFFVVIIGVSFASSYLNYIAIILALLGVLSVYFIYLSFKENKKNYGFAIIPLLISATALSLWTASKLSGFALRDYIVIALIFSIFLLSVTLYTHRLLKLRVALISAIFLCTLLLHLAPAGSVEGVTWSGRYLSALDPYYYYRHADYIVETGHVPDHETLVYPTDPPDFSNSRFMVSVLMGAMSSILVSFGFTVYDVAMIYPGVFAAFSVLLIYLLVRDLFADMEPYNYAAAILAAFMLMLNPAFAIKAIATNCEDDALGMFLIISSFLLFTLSFRRKSYLFSLLSGFSFLMLNLSWNGYVYAITVFGVFAVFYAFISFLNNRNCTEHIPFFIIPVLISFLYPLILHPRGGLPVFTLPGKLLLISISAPIAVSFILELVRSLRSGKLKVDGSRIEDRVECFIQDNIRTVSAVVIVFGLFFSLAVMGPSDMIDFILSNIQGAKVSEIIGMTTAEQAALCRGFNIFDAGSYSPCLNTLMASFGIASIIGLFMIPILLYFAVKKHSMGSVFVLAWSLPMIWGVINKSQYQFTASVPLVVLAASFGLVITMKKKDFEGLRVIPLTLLLATPIFFYFLQGGMPLFEPFGGMAVMYRGMPGDIVYWDPTLSWIGTQPEDSVILTWWDYGHWISAISQRTSIADNTKARRFVVQDLAKFHVLIENESEALDIAEKYGATHVVIDYTMIGKSGAPHFIATSNLTAPYDDPSREGEHMGYGQCKFSPSNSKLSVEYVSDGQGGFNKKRTIVFSCNIAGDYREYIGSIIFEIINDLDIEVKVNPLIKRADGSLALGRAISWESWTQEHKASILGIHSPMMLLSNAVAYKENKGNYINFPTYNTLVYVPEKFNKYMMTSLYLGDFMDEYKQLGLCDPMVQKLENFELMDGFRGTPNEFNSGTDVSYLGYVRAYKINYPSNVSGVDSVNSTAFFSGD